MGQDKSNTRETMNNTDVIERFEKHMKSSFKYAKKVEFAVDTIWLFNEDFRDDFEFDLKNFLLQELERAEKAYGGCHHCFGKGYRTKLDFKTYHADFEGDRTITEKGDYYIPCLDCDRGKQIKEMIERVRREERERIKKELSKLQTYYHGFTDKTEYISKNALDLKLQTLEESK